MSVILQAVEGKSLIENRRNKHKNKTYLITGPEALSYHQIAARILSNTTGRKINYVNISDEKTKDSNERDRYE